MDGSPLARLVVVVVFLVLLGLPVIVLTREKPSPEVPVNAPAPVAESQVVSVVATLSHPGKVEIRLADQVVAVAETPVSTLEKAITLPTARAELSVKFEWPDAGTANAGRIVVSHDGDIWADQTFWGEAEAQDVVTLEGAHQP